MVQLTEAGGATKRVEQATIEAMEAKTARVNDAAIAWGEIARLGKRNKIHTNRKATVITVVTTVAVMIVFMGFSGIDNPLPTLILGVAIGFLAGTAYGVLTFRYSGRDDLSTSNEAFRRYVDALAAAGELPEPFTRVGSTVSLSYRMHSEGVFDIGGIPYTMRVRDDGAVYMTVPKEYVGGNSELNLVRGDFHTLYDRVCRSLAANHPSRLA